MPKNIWVCLGSGESLNDQDISYARSKGVRFAVCNDNWQKAPDCEIVVAFDYKWWEMYHTEVDVATKAEFWTGSVRAEKQFGLHRFKILPGIGWSTRRGFVHNVGLSGGILLQRVGWEHPDLIVLLGYDMQGSHWFGDHPPQLGNQTELADAIPDFNRLAQQAPCKVVNCSRQTALDCFPRRKITEVL